MNVVNLGEKSSVLNAYVAQIRNRDFQKDGMRFRENLKRIGCVFGYEISRTMSSENIKVTTPLGEAILPVPSEKVVVGTILRAGLPLHEGVLSCFDNAGNAFVTAFRKYESDGEFEIRADYCTSPDLTGKTLIIADTMLATGSSIDVAYKQLCAKCGTPSKLHLVCPISSSYAVEQLKKKMPENSTLWVAAIDPELTSHSYIVPGLGDAGDLAYGDKL